MQSFRIAIRANEIIYHASRGPDGQAPWGIKTRKKELGYENLSWRFGSCVCGDFVDRCDLYHQHLRSPDLISRGDEKPLAPAVSRLTPRVIRKCGYCLGWRDEASPALSVSRSGLTRFYDLIAPKINQLAKLPCGGAVDLPWAKSAKYSSLTTPRSGMRV